MSVGVPISLILGRSFAKSFPPRRSNIQLVCSLNSGSCVLQENMRSLAVYLFHQNSVHPCSQFFSMYSPRCGAPKMNNFDNLIQKQLTQFSEFFSGAKPTPPTHALPRGGVDINKMCSLPQGVNQYGPSPPLPKKTIDFSQPKA